VRASRTAGRVGRGAAWKTADVSSLDELRSRGPARGSAVPGRAERIAGFAATVAALLGTLALFAVFVFWGGSNSSSALPYFAVPGALLLLSVVLGYWAWLRRPAGSVRQPRRPAGDGGPALR